MGLSITCNEVNKKVINRTPRKMSCLHMVLTCFESIIPPDVEPCDDLYQ